MCDMKRPTPCYHCGEICDIRSLSFHTGNCECHWDEDCTHGLCPLCYDLYGDDEDEE